MIEKKTTYQIGNAVVVVTRPALSESERKKRESVIVNALAQYGKAASA